MCPKLGHVFKLKEMFKKSSFFLSGRTSLVVGPLVVGPLKKELFLRLPLPGVQMPSQGLSVHCRIQLFLCNLNKGLYKSGAAPYVLYNIQSKILYLNYMYSAGPKSCYPPPIKVTFTELCGANYVKDKNLIFFAINHIFPK